MKKETAEQTPTIITAPAGEWQSTLLSIMELAGLKVQRPLNTREYTTRVWPNEVFAHPVLFAWVRATDAKNLMKQNPSVSAALTGTDILFEQISNPDNIIDISEQTPWLPQVWLKLFATPNGLQQDLLRRRSYKLQNQMTDYTPAKEMTAQLISALEGSTVYSSRPRATKRYFGNANVDVRFQSGKLEGLWQINPKNQATADVSVTGNTAKANGLQPIDSIERVRGLGIVTNPAISSESANAVTDLLRALDLKKQWRVEETSTSDLYQIGNVSYCVVRGFDKKRKKIPVPVFFSSYRQTEQQACQLLGVDGRIETLESDPSGWTLRRLDGLVSAEILRLIERALQIGGYVLIPQPLIDLENYNATPNNFVGVH